MTSHSDTIFFPPNVPIYSDDIIQENTSLRSAFKTHLQERGMLKYELEIIKKIEHDQRQVLKSVADLVKPGSDSNYKIAEKKVKMLRQENEKLCSDFENLSVKYCEQNQKLASLELEGDGLTAAYEVLKSHIKQKDCIITAMSTENSILLEGFRDMTRKSEQLEEENGKLLEEKTELLLVIRTLSDKLKQQDRDAADDRMKWELEVSSLKARLGKAIMELEFEETKISAKIPIISSSSPVEEKSVVDLSQDFIWEVIDQEKK